MIGKRYPNELKMEVFRLLAEGKSQVYISRETGIPRSTLQNILKDEEHLSTYGYDAPDEDEIEYEEDPEIIAENLKLAKQKQRLQDSQRIERKSFREFARADNMIVSLHEQILENLEKYNFADLTAEHEHDYVSPVGVVQLSDLHFNELVNDLSGNVFNMGMASKRIHKHISEAKKIFNAFGIKNVALFMTGDVLNSDRRVSEITESATNRSNAMFVAVDVLQQAIRDLNKDFNVTVASITGNESRVKEFVDWTNFLASDSYDIAIHNMLMYLFKDSKGVNFIPVTNPLECVVDVNGTKFLLVHGHGHKGLARTSNIENEVERIKARYASKGVVIDYVICGHIHSAFISDLYARSSGLPGSNAYSERALNLNGKASQNIFIVKPNKTIHGIKVDLQDVKGYSGYGYEESLQAYHNQYQGDGTVVIQSVLV